MRLRGLLGGCLAAVLLLIGHDASAQISIGASGNLAGVSAQTQHPFGTIPPNDSNWLINQFVEFDPSAGPWIKELGPPVPGCTAPSCGFAPGSYVLEEELTVGFGTQPWTDWHEEILTPGWTFASISSSVPTSGGLPVTAGATVADIIFLSAIQPGDSVTLIKALTFDDQAAGANAFASVELRQYPTVPIPGAVWLFAPALGLLGWLGRKRARTA